jgi:hypothetical protein
MISKTLWWKNVEMLWWGKKWFKTSALSLSRLLFTPAKSFFLRRNEVLVVTSVEEAKKWVHFMRWDLCAVESDICAPKLYFCLQPTQRWGGGRPLWSKLRYVFSCQWTAWPSQHSDIYEMSIHSRACRACRRVAQQNVGSAIFEEV